LAEAKDLIAFISLAWSSKSLVLFLLICSNRTTNQSWIYFSYT